MEQPDAVSRSDRTLMIGVLANLCAGFTGLGLDAAGAANLLDHMMQRYRRDFGQLLGREPSGEECRQALEDQIRRLRVSIGED